MMAQKTSLRKNGKILILNLYNLEKYYTHSYTLRGLKGNFVSSQDKNIINSPNGFLWGFSYIYYKKTVHEISYFQSPSCIYGKDTRWIQNWLMLVQECHLCGVLWYLLSVSKTCTSL